MSKDTSGSGGGSCTLGLGYHGGPVLHTPRIHIIPWLPFTGWGGSSLPNFTVLQNLAKDFMSLPVAAVLAEYPDSTGASTTNVSFAEQHDLTSAYPAAGTVANPITGAEIAAAIDGDPSNRSTDPNDVYVVVIPPGVQVCSDSSHCSFTNLGGWHNTTPGGRTYAVLLGSAGSATPYAPNDPEQRAAERHREMGTRSLAATTLLGRPILKLATLEKKYDVQFRMVFDAIRELTTPPAKAKRRIGF
jgi:hypothetical protein